MSIDVAATDYVSTAVPVFNGIFNQAPERSGKQLVAQLTADPLYTDAECAKYPLRLYSMGIGSFIGANYNRATCLHHILLTQKWWKREYEVFLTI